MIIEKITKDDLELYEIIRHPILFGEFYRNLDIPTWSDEVWEYSLYQKEYLGDFSPYQSLCCARSVGKTVTLTDFILWIMINNLFPGEYILYTVPNKVHLEPVFTNLIRGFRTNTLLKHFIEPKKGINSSTHTIGLLNSALLMCRIAGTSGTGANVVGLHTPIVILDEAGYYPWGTWSELQPVLNTFQPGAKLWVAGVPTGLRENNVLYYSDEVEDSFSRHQTSAHDNPRYSEKDEIRNLAQYGGVDSEDYIHFVLGRHGSPTFAVFDRRLMEIKTYPTYRIKFSGMDLVTYKEMRTRMTLIPPVPDNEFVVLGIDLGYTEDTAIMVLYEKDGHLYEHVRINLVKVEYPDQEKLIDFLDTRLQPSIIGIDESGPGKGLVQNMLSHEDYAHKEYYKRMFPVDFSSSVVLGLDEDGKEIKVKTKQQSVTLLQEYSNSHKIIYSTTDMELITEMERMTYTKNPTGMITYKTLTPRGGERGDDHNTAAMLCAAMAYYMKMDHILIGPRKKPLLKSKWIMGGI